MEILRIINRKRVRYWALTELIAGVFSFNSSPASI